MIQGGSNDERLTDVDSIGTTSYIGQPLVVAVLYKCSNTVEQSVIPRGSNDERLTNVDKHNCCPT